MEQIDSALQVKIGYDNAVMQHRNHRLTGVIPYPIPSNFAVGFCQAIIEISQQQNYQQWRQTNL